MAYSTLEQADVPPEAVVPGLEPARYSYTYQSMDGNRIIGGSADLAAMMYTEIELPFRPAWIVGGEVDAGGLFVATSEEGEVAAILVAGDSFTRVDVESDGYLAGMPPILEFTEDGYRLLTSPWPESSRFTHPFPLGAGGGILTVLDDGRVRLGLGESVEDFQIGVLPDARLVLDNQGFLAAYAGSTDRYDHGALGDVLEASQIALFDVTGGLRQRALISLEPGEVFEGIAPILADFDGDGVSEIVTTVSDRLQGSRLQVYTAGGEPMASSPAIGQGYRWRHQLAAGPFDPMAQFEIAVVRTPHLGGVLEFFALQDGKLVLTASLPGFGSHVLGSRNLDMALAGDFDQDGRLEILVPSQDRRELDLVGRTSGGAVIDLRIPLGGLLSTNLSAIRTLDGAILLAVGTSEGSIRIWHH